jgi:YVTN family beta-propeller protein
MNALKGGPFAYIPNYGSGSVSVIDTQSGALTRTIAVGNTPWSAAVTPDGNTLYVPNSGSNNVSIINTVTSAVTGTNTVTVTATDATWW